MRDKKIQRHSLLLQDLQIFDDTSLNEKDGRNGHGCTGKEINGIETFVTTFWFKNETVFAIFRSNIPDSTATIA